MDRRHFLARLLQGTVATVAAVPVLGALGELDWDRLLWVPGAKTIFLPPPRPPLELRDLDELWQQDWETAWWANDPNAQRDLRAAVQSLAAQIDEDCLKHVTDCLKHVTVARERYILTSRSDEGDLIVKFDQGWNPLAGQNLSTQADMTAAELAQLAPEKVRAAGGDMVFRGLTMRKPERFVEVVTGRQPTSPLADAESRPGEWRHTVGLWGKLVASDKGKAGV